MSGSEGKPWEKPWTTEEIIANASNWSLAGDAGLLKHLESFSERMLSRAQDTHERLDKLLDSANEASLSLSNVTNKFMGLHNTQFIESRVYEDDETLPVNKEPEKVEKPKPSDTERLEEIKQIVLSGLGIIDKYYEKVEVPVSDSEDDGDETSIVFRPIDPYINRPLPYLIGTPEWHKSWHVGLLESSSESEHENEQEQFSETESEHEIKEPPMKKKAQIPDSTDSDSEQDTSKTNILNPVASSTFNSQTSKDMFDTSSEEETTSLPPQINNVNTNFLSELASKLGQVEKSADPDVNTRPMKKPPSSIPGGIFYDEPPPLEDEDDIFTNKSMASGLFPAKNGLFDDLDEDDDFWETKKPSGVAKPPPIKSIDDVDFEPSPADENLFSNVPKKDDGKTTKIFETKKISGGLFNDDDDDDDTFTKSLLKPPQTSIFRSHKTTAPLINDQPPDLETNAVKKPSAIPTVKESSPPLFDSTSKSVLTNQISKIIKNRPPSTSESDAEPEIPKISQQKGKVPTIDKANKLFEKDSSLFNDDLFSSTQNKRFSAGLFDAEPPPLDAPKKHVEENGKSTKSISRDNNLFNSEPPPLDVNKPSKSFLFDDDDDYDDLFSKKSSTKSTKPSTKKTVSLFSDTEDDISEITTGKSLFESNHASVTDNVSKIGNVNLFDSNPLDFNGSKSDTQNDITENASAARSLFDVPTIGGESGIVPDQSARYESEDSSFFPGASSSRRLSTDIFQDEQRNDSLFITKSKTNIESNLFTKSDLNSISEISVITEPSLFDSPDSDRSKSNNTIGEETSSSLFGDTKNADKINKIVEPQSNIFDAIKPDDASNKLFGSPDSDMSKSSNTIGEETSSSLFGGTKNADKINKIVEPQSNIFDAIKPDDASNKLFDSPDSDMSNSSNTIGEETSSSLFHDTKSADKIKKIVAPQDAIKSNDSSIKISLFEDKSNKTIEEESPRSLFDTKNVEPQSDLFDADKPHISINKTSLFGESKTNNTSEDTSQSLFGDVNQIVEPQGNIFDAIKPDVTSNKISLFGDKPNDSKNIVETKKQNNIFDDYDDMFQSIKSSKQTKNIKLFDNSDSDDDLFSSRSSNAKHDNIFRDQSQGSKLLKEVDDDLFSTSKSVPDVDLFAKSMNTDLKSDHFVKNDLDVDQGRSLEVKSVAVENINAEQSVPEETKKVPSPKKLVHNLNINVSALIPGATLPKKITDKKENETKTQDAESDSKISSVEDIKSNDVIRTIGKLEDTKKTDEPDGEIVSPAISPRRRLPNLNINVAALLPGAAPPRRNMEKSVSLDSDKAEDSQKVATFNDRPKSELTLDTRPGLEKSISFDTPVEATDILTSAVKERAKITAKRKPSTRRGRQEAIRKSGIDFAYDDPILGITNSIPSIDNVDSPPTNQIDSQNILNNNLNEPKTEKESLNIKFPANDSEHKPKDAGNLFSPSTDEEDQFSIPRDTSDTSEENALFGKAQLYSPVDKAVVIDKIDNTDSLFESSKPNEISDNLLNTSADTKKLDSKFDDIFPYDNKYNPKKAVQNTKESKPKMDTSLFSSSDSESDLFGSGKDDGKKDKDKKINVQSSESKPSIFDDDEDSNFTFNTKKIMPTAKANKSLFDDDDDLEDDIFGSSSNSSKTKPTNAQSTNPIKKSVTQLKKVPVEFSDDLDSMLGLRKSEIDDPLEVLKNK